MINIEDFVFVSDFDGTMTDKDFYHIVIDKYLDWGRDYYEEWVKEKPIDLEFLNKIFSSIDKKEEDILSDIHGIPFDDSVIPFIKRVRESGGDFIILSAGTSYYIEKLLGHKGIRDIKVVSNKGRYTEGGIEIMTDEKGPYYSKSFGIDKARVVAELKGKYKKVYYAGDSRPDLEAAMKSDIAFARRELKRLLDERNHYNIPFQSFRDIERTMVEKGWLDEGAYK